MDITGVPESIEREKVQAFLTDLGLDINYVVAVHIRRNSVEAEVYARNTDGTKYATSSDDDQDVVAIHTIHIPLIPDWND